MLVEILAHPVLPVPEDATRRQNRFAGMIHKESNVLAPVYLALDPGGLQMAPHVVLCDGVVAAGVSAHLELLAS